MQDAILTIGFERYAVDAEDAIKIMLLMRKARPVDNFYDEVNRQSVFVVRKERPAELKFELIGADRILEEKPAEKEEDRNAVQAA